MMSEFVAASAWIWPPVDDWLLAKLVLAALAPATAPGPGGAVVCTTGLVPAAVPELAERAARKVTASLVASAFFR